MNVNDLTIGQVCEISSWLRAADSPAPGHLDDPDGELRIVVLQRGFVVVGNVRQHGAEVRIDPCACVRRWGTTRGLGELAERGPLENTVLDKQSETIVHELAIVEQIRCNAVAWEGKL